MVAPEPLGLDTPRWLEHCIRDSRYCWCDCHSLAACANGFVLRFYIIELTFNAWDKNDPRNSCLLRDDVRDQRPIFTNEVGKVYVRRNGYTPCVNGTEEMLRLRSTDFHQVSEKLPVDMQNLARSSSDDDSDSDEFFSYESM